MLKALRTLDEILVQSDAKPSSYNPIMRRLYAIAESHTPFPFKGPDRDDLRRHLC